MGEQDLRGMQSMAQEGAVVGLGQPHLADSGSGLQFMDRLRPLHPAQALHAAGDGARRDEHDFPALPAQRRDLARPVMDGGQVEAAAVVGDEGGADLDD